jgi:hypothetical protein
MRISAERPSGNGGWSPCSVGRRRNRGRRRGRLERDKGTTCSSSSSWSSSSSIAEEFLGIRVFEERRSGNGDGARALLEAKESRTTRTIKERRGNHLLVVVVVVVLGRGFFRYTGLRGERERKRRMEPVLCGGGGIENEDDDEDDWRETREPPARPRRRGRPRPRSRKNF